MAYNHFSYVPSSVTEDRSGFKFSKHVPQAAQLGWLYPMCKPVFMYPGSTLKIDKLGMEIRSGGLIAPLMTELFCDCFAFNIPNRIVWEHWKQFLGAVDDVLFDNLTEYQIPNFKYGMGLYDGVNEVMVDAFSSGQENYQWNQTIACHFELPYPKKTVSSDEWSDFEYVNISVLPFRGYDFIVNEYFLPEFLNDRVLFSKTDNGYSGDNMTGDIQSTNLWQRWATVNTLYPSSLPYDAVTVGGLCWPVSRAHRSLWTACLPKPSLETLNLLAGVTGLSPVFATDDLVGKATNSLEWYHTGDPDNIQTGPASLGIGSSGKTGIITNSPTLDNAVTPANLWSDVSKAVLTVNNYRETILLDNYYTALNRAGSRYDEIIANLFHVRTSMAVISIPELIVHKRFTIYRKEVVSTAQTNNGSTVVKPLGSQAAYIDTIIKDSFFIKSTTEHGYIHMLYCIRPAQIVMTSGFEPDWLRLDKLSQFYPQFQGMGDVPRKKMEVVYGFSSADSKTAVLGYQEYSAEDKYQRSSAIGWLDPHTPTPINGYVICDDYDVTSNVSLNNYFLSCASEEVTFGNCLAITDPTVAPQFIVDIRLEGTIYHPMKVYNIPGQGDLL